jgi:hypothetical protein
MGAQDDYNEAYEDGMKHAVGAKAPLPTVHLNGTSREALLRQQLDVIRALQNAKRVICENAPHARDYYVQKDPQAFAKARDACIARVQTLDALIAEYTAIAEHLT